MRHLRFLWPFRKDNCWHFWRRGAWTSPTCECDPCARSDRYTCMCGGTKGCGCRLTEPPTHFHADGRYLGATCPNPSGEGL